jgi:predicted PurR-regulated permease PerM
MYLGTQLVRTVSSLSKGGNETMDFNNKYFKYTIWTLLIVLIIFYFAQLNFITNFIKNIFTITIIPIIFASFFYYLLRPLVQFLVKRKVNRTIAVMSVLFLIIGFISVLIAFAGSAIIKDFSSYYETIIEYFKQAPERLEGFLNQYGFQSSFLENFESNLLKASQTIFNAITQGMSGWVSNITRFGTIMILIPIIVFFLLKDDELLYETIVKIIPSKVEERLINIMKKIDHLLQTYFLGQIVVAGILGILTYIGYLIIGIPNALFLATFTMFLSIIPLLGPFIGMIPAVFIGWTVGPLMILKVIIVLVVTQQLEGNIVRPKVMGSRLNIHPMVIIFLVIVAVTLYGFIGAFFVIPLYGVVRIIIKDVLSKRGIIKNDK